MDSLGSRVRARRNQLKMSQAELAVASGLGQAFISKVENNHIQKTSAVLALARVLQCSPEYLDTGDNPPEGAPISTKTTFPRNSPGEALALIVSVFEHEPQGARTAAAELIAHALRRPEDLQDMAERLNRLGGGADPGT